MHRFKTGAVVALIAITLAVSAGCTVQGHPMRAQIDVSSLDVGSYSRTPLDVPNVHTEKYGRVVESVRLGEVVIDPMAADPALTFPGNGFGGVPLPTAAKAVAFLALPIRPVLERHGLLAGFAASGSDKAVERTPAVGQVRLLTALVLRFPDPAAAQQAAAEIDSVDAGLSPDNVAITIPGYAGAHGHWRPNVPTIAVTIAHESFVLSLLVGHTSTDLGTMTALARKTIDLQLPHLAEFTATPRDQLAALPLDRDGMLARMAPKAPGRWPFPSVVFGGRQENAGWGSAVTPTGIVYGPQAARTLLGNQVTNPPELLALNGLEALFRFQDPTVARRAFDKGVRGDQQDGVRAVAGPSGVPDVWCGQLSDSDAAKVPFHFICRVLYGRHVALLYGRQLRDFQQRVAAQHALLVHSGRDS